MLAGDETRLIMRRLRETVDRLMGAFTDVGIAGERSAASSSIRVTRQARLRRAERAAGADVISDVTYILTCLCIIDHSATRHVDICVFSVSAMTFVTPTVTAMFCIDMTLIFQVKQCPEVVISPEINASSISSVASIGASVGLILYMTQVHGASSALSRAAINLYVVNEIGVHNIVYSEDFLMKNKTLNGFKIKNLRLEL